MLGVGVWDNRDQRTKAECDVDGTTAKAYTDDRGLSKNNKRQRILMTAAAAAMIAPLRNLQEALGKLDELKSQ